MSIMVSKNIKVGLVIMASGIGRRFGGNKLMEDLDGKPLIKWIIDTTEGLFDKRVVVTRSSEIKALCDSLNIDCIIHDFPNRNDTIKLGLCSLMEEVDYCFFAQADQPLIKRDTITKLIVASRDNSDRIVRTSYGGIEGSPVGFPKSFFGELINLPEKKGGNYIVKNNSELVCTVKAQNEYELWDVDTVADLEIIKDILNK